MVPLAKLAGNPKAIKTEYEIIVPLPARVFIKPTKKPATIRTPIINGE
jgi:hypothetical protein